MLNPPVSPLPVPESDSRVFVRTPLYSDPRSSSGNIVSVRIVGVRDPRDPTSSTSNGSTEDSL